MADTTEIVETENATTEDDMEVVTMVDVLKEEQELEEDTKAVLGASDDKNCTYPQGYIKRQALYACMTCTPISEDLSMSAGVCLACSYKCHEGHSLVELYTKRNFRCDCGNKKFCSNKCSLESDKDDYNTLNIYNQNFNGLYCICKRPYPDPEDTVSDEMVQCAVCEDWYHFRHLNVDTVIPENYVEMVCQCCMAKYDFFSSYSKIILNSTMNPEQVVIGENSAEVANTSDSLSDVNVTSDTETESDSTTAQVATGVCIKPNVKVDITSATFWPENWRAQLCKCIDCVKTYRTLGVPYITEFEDTVRFYEDKGKADPNTQTQYEAGLEALSSLDRVKQVEAISEYNEMKNHLKEYLQKFVDSKKVVREEDIKEFFSGMTERKKQRHEIPHFCR